MVITLHVVSIDRRGIGFAFGFCWLLRGPEPSGAEMSAVLDVVIFGQRRDHGRAAFDLADAVENDLGAAVVHFHGAADLDGTSREAADVAHILQIIGEDHDGEGAGHLVFAEVEEVDTLIAYLDSYHASGDAFGFADVPGGFVDRNAVGGLGGQRE